MSRETAQAAREGGLCMSGAAVPQDQSATEILVEQLAAQPDAEERCALIAAHPAEQLRDLLTTVTTRVLRQVRVSTVEALRLGDSAITVAERLATPAARAEALRSKA